MIGLPKKNAAGLVAACRRSATVAMQARRYMHEYGATSEDFGRVAVAAGVPRPIG